MSGPARAPAGTVAAFRDPVPCRPTNLSAPAAPPAGVVDAARARQAPQAVRRLELIRAANDEGGGIPLPLLVAGPMALNDAP